jgi:hypothetical protein
MHHEISEKLSDYLDDELTPPERHAVDAHLQECDECAATLADLRRIAAAGAALRDTPPSSDFWPAIAARIAAGPRAAVPPPRRRFALTLPQLAAASLLLAALSGWLAVRVLSPARPDSGSAVTAGGTLPSDGGDGTVVPITFDEQQYDAAIRELQQAIDRGRSRLDPETIGAVERNLRLIDQAVDDAQRALAADPSSGYLSGYMVQTRQRKLELLRQVAVLIQVDAR